MTHGPWGFDSLLAIALLWLAWSALSIHNLFRAVILFIAFGLLMALAWVRLGATDIALAEAAIGAGLTGALFLVALGSLGPAARADTHISEQGALRDGHAKE